MPLAEGGAQRVVQVGAVEVVEGRAPAYDRLVAERHAAEERAGAPVARVEREGADGDGGEGVGEAEVVQDPGRVGPMATPAPTSRRTLACS